MKKEPLQVADSSRHASLSVNAVLTLPVTDRSAPRENQNARFPTFRESRFTGLILIKFRNVQPRAAMHYFHAYDFGYAFGTLIHLLKATF